MKILKNSWYMIGWADELAPGLQLRRVIANEPVLVTAAGDGALSARIDAPGGRIVPAVKKHRILWVWVGDADACDVSAISDFTCFDETKDTAFFSGYLPTKANYELLSDNILDLSHADFLHPDTLGGGIFTRYPPKFERSGNALTLTWEAPNDPTLPILAQLLPDPEKPAHTRISVRWEPAAVMLLRTQVAPAGEPLEKGCEGFAAHIMTPESECQTHYFYGAGRNYGVDDAELTALQARLIGHAFATEDKPMVEAQQRALGEADFWDLRPVLLPIDTGAVQARRMLSRLIRQEAPAA